MFPRSTKGASKMRRENINSEIGMIRDCLPVQEAIRKRLSQLQVMALCKAFIGKSNTFSKLPPTEPSPFEIFREMFDFTQTLPGFLLMTNVNGRILYISENVMEFLGHSMVDVMTQSETIFDLVDSNDKHLFEDIFGSEEQFNENATPSEVRVMTPLLDKKLMTFTCRMGMLRHARRNPSFDRHKKMRICGRFVQIAESEDPSDQYFVALCTPRLNPVMAAEPSTIFDTMVYQSVHRLDMRFVNLDHNGQFHLGYTQEAMFSKSWYELIHPEDVHMAAKKHKELLQASSADMMCSLCVRMQTRDGNLIWIQVIMQRAPANTSNLDGNERLIICVNHVISENEANLDEKEELLMINPISFNGNYSVDSNVSKSAIPTIVVDEVFGEVKPDRAEVLRRLKRKMTGQEEKRNKIARNSSSGSAPSFLVDDMSPFSVGNSLSVNSGLSFNESSCSSMEPVFSSPSPGSIHGGAYQVPSSIYSPLSVAEYSPLSYGSSVEDNGMVLCSMPTPERTQDFGSPIPNGSFDEQHEDTAFMNAFEECYDDTSLFLPTAMFSKAAMLSKQAAMPESKKAVALGPYGLPELDSVLLASFFENLEEVDIPTEKYPCLDMEMIDQKPSLYNQQLAKDHGYVGQTGQSDWPSFLDADESNFYFSSSTPYSDGLNFQSQIISAGRNDSAWVM